MAASRNPQATRRTRRPNWLLHGIPYIGLTLIAIALLAALVVLASLRDPSGAVRAYAEFTAFEEGCLINTARSHNAIECTRRRDGVYDARFSTSLALSTIVVSRGSCCPGTVAASVKEDDSNEVIVTFGPDADYPIVASIVAS